ncbi:MAG: lipopolysaccharide transport periplasmic protein LptA [Gammaproteobacteria bacterium]|nr:lipopolysaccharide transport periplasmic protein LptA [Gammaproteobacteria bacterium]MBU1656140.1 lipopolysaccharide transport periplasmic protein LptA [Gammaproteobacteria bacterium]MBU1960784.1 lipopolysaccharide transport periplasmic protein LptA [Gammaproteobacteria bacterium]
MHGRSLSALAILMILLMPAAAWALKSDAEQPITVEADSADIDDGNKRSIYTGSVVITQGTIRLEADKVIVSKPASGQGNNLHAEGKPVRFQQAVEGKKAEVVRGRARKMEYDSDSELMHLIGDAHLTQEGSSFSSDRITYDRIKSLVTGGAAASGKQRVRMTIRTGKTPQQP